MDGNRCGQPYGAAYERNWKGTKGAWTDADAATTQLIHDTLSDIVRGQSTLHTPGELEEMTCAIRNLGRPGILRHAT